MPRSQATINAYLLKNLPSWVKNLGDSEQALLDGLCALMAQVEAAQETLLLTRTRIATADGSFLDELGRERGIYRFMGETDAAYRPRIQGVEDAVSVPAILAHVNALLVVPSATLYEHRTNTLYACDDGSGFLYGFGDVFYTYDDNLAFTVYIPFQVATNQNTDFSIEYGSTTKLGFGSESNSTGSSPSDPGMFASGGPGAVAASLYGTIWQTINRLRAAGVSFTVVVGAS